jgi:spore coat protein CotH
VWEFTVLPTPGRANGSFPVQGKDAGDAVFQDRWVSQIDLQLSQASLASLATDPYQEVPGSIGYGTVWFPSVGIHLKGGWGSLRTLQEKAGFKVDLNEYETHHIAGQKMLTLNSMVQDPTFLHEYLAYTVYRELQLPAPRTGWVYVTVNGTYYGIYLWVETIDDWFLDAWWDSPDGALYEGAYGVDLTTGAEFAFEYDGGPNPDDRSELTELIALLNVEPSEEVLVNLESRLDVDQVLLVLAVEAGTLHWDGYTTKNNYRLYHDPVTKQFSMIPWGTDQTWVDWWYGPYDGQGHFFQWCLAIESCKVRYNDALLKVADVLEALPLLSMLNQSYAWIEPIIKEEPFYEHGDESRADFLERTIETITIMPDYLREQVQAAQ